MPPASTNPARLAAQPSERSKQVSNDPKTQLDAAVEEKMHQNEEHDPVPGDLWGTKSPSSATNAAREIRALRAALAEALDGWKFLLDDYVDSDERRRQDRKRIAELRAKFWGR